MRVWACSACSACLAGSRLGLCEHGRRRRQSDECGSAKHGRQRYLCKDCGGKGICRCHHERRRSVCKKIDKRLYLTANTFPERSVWERSPGWFETLLTKILFFFLWPSAGARLRGAAEPVDAMIVSSFVTSRRRPSTRQPGPSSLNQAGPSEPQLDVHTAAAVAHGVLFAVFSVVGFVEGKHVSHSRRWGVMLGTLASARTFACPNIGLRLGCV